MMYTYKIKQVEKVTDGDTVVVTIDLGFDVTIRKSIRLNGTDAPETRTRSKEIKERGLKAKAWLADRLKNGVGDLIVTTYKTEKFGRFLGDLRFDGDTETINQEMIREGHAVPYYGGKKKWLTEL